MNITTLPSSITVFLSIYYCKKIKKEEEIKQLIPLRGNDISAIITYIIYKAKKEH